MSTEEHPTICITCGMSADTQGRLNRLEDGRACPSCCDRILDALPPLLPSDAREAWEATSWVEDSKEGGENPADGESSAPPPAG